MNARFEIIDPDLEEEGIDRIARGANIDFRVDCEKASAAGLSSRAVLCIVPC